MRYYIIFIKSLLITLLLSLSVVVLADNHEKSATPAIEPAPPHLGTYLDFFAGYAFVDWSKFTNDGDGAWAQIGGGIRPNQREKGGYTFGLDLGYQFLRYLGMEFGYYDFGAVKGDGLQIEIPYYYAAAKVSYPFLENDDLSLFAKLGAAYRVIEYNGAAQEGPYQNKRYNFNLVYGLGAQYYISHRWRVAAQWLEIPKYTSGGPYTAKSSKQVPRVDQVLLGIGYLFCV